MDITSHPSYNSAYCEFGWDCGWCILCHKQWLPVLGSTIWQAVLRYLGHCPSIPILEGSLGQAKSYPNHCYCLVRSSCFNILLAVGEDWSLHLWLQQINQWSMWHQLLVLLYDSFCVVIPFCLEIHKVAVVYIARIFSLSKLSGGLNPWNRWECTLSVSIIYLHVPYKNSQ